MNNENKWMDAQALGDARMLCEYAYERGFHELGYSPIEAIAAVMREAMGELSEMERTMIGIAPEAVSRALPKLRALLAESAPQ